MKNKHITLLLLAGVFILIGLFMINNWIRENSARQEIKANPPAATQETK